MIKSINLRNFQSHEDTTVEFVEGINVLSGTSSHGKTAILRGLSWVLENKPDGKQFISYWNRKNNGDPSDETSATVDFSNTTIKRLKKGGDNHYIVDGETLTTVGRGVPEQVTDATKMDILNVHKQLDAPFLLSMSGGEVAKYLNSLVNLDLIDTALSNANGEIRALSGKINEVNQYILIGEREVSELSWVDRAVELATKLEELDRKESEVEEECKKLLEETEAYKRYMAVYASTEKVVTDAMKRLDFLAKNEIEMSTISNEVTSLTEQSKKLKEWNDLIDKYGVVVRDASTLLAKVDPLDKKISVLEEEVELGLEHQLSYSRILQTVRAGHIIQEASALLDKEQSIVAKGKDLRNHIEATIESLTKYRALCVEMTLAETDLAEAIAELPTTCPTCGQDWHNAVGCVK